MTELGRINVFYSYAHKDEAHRDRLVRSLTGLRKEGVISEWHDRMIRPGSDWSREIEDKLERAHVVLFLVSPDFMKSEYSMGVEVARAVELHWQRRGHIVPVIVRPAPGWKRTPLGSFQALPRDAKPVSTWDSADSAFADIAEGIRRVCKEIVDWENPIRRSNTGDWVEREQTMLAQGQRVVSRVRSEITAKDDRTATITSVANISGQALRIDLQIPLDAPTEDNLGQMLKQLGEPLPANSQYYRAETGRGDQRLLVGGKPYHCHWASSVATFDSGSERVVVNEKVWRCIDVPVDGVVKEESAVGTESGQDIFRKSILLVGHGHGALRSRGRR